MDIGTYPFLSRQHKDAKQWAKEKAAKLFGTVRVAGTVAAALPASPAGATQQAPPPQDFQKIAEALIAIQAAGSPAKAAGNVAAKLFGMVRVAGTVAAALPASTAGATQQAPPPQDFQKIAEALIAIQAAGSPAKAAGNVAIVADTDANLCKTYGLCCPLDIERMLTMCGLQSGQEDRLPD